MYTFVIMFTPLLTGSVYNNVYVCTCARVCVCVCRCMYRIYALGMDAVQVLLIAKFSVLLNFNSISMIHYS